MLEQEDRRMKRFEPVYLLLGLIVLFYIAGELSGGNRNAKVLLMLGGNWFPLVKDGEWWRTVTAIFLHGGTAHLLVNGISLFVLGRFVSRLYGAWAMLAVFTFSGVAASLVSGLSTGGLSIGSSGAVSGLFGLVLLFVWRYRERLEPRFRRSFMQNLLLIIAINVFIAMTVSNIDHSAHLGGLLAGGIAGLLLTPLSFASTGTMKRTRAAGFSAALLVATALGGLCYSLLFSMVIPFSGRSTLLQPPHNGWQLRYPAAWHVDRVEKGIYRLGSYYYRGFRCYSLSESEWKARLQALRDGQTVLRTVKLDGRSVLTAAGEQQAGGDRYYFYQALLSSKDTQGRRFAVLEAVRRGRPLTETHRSWLRQLVKRFSFQFRGAI